MMKFHELDTLRLRRLPQNVQFFNQMNPFSPERIKITIKTPFPAGNGVFIAQFRMKLPGFYQFGCEDYTFGGVNPQGVDPGW